MSWRRRSALALVAASGVCQAACVPADEALPLGSVAFVIQASDMTHEGTGEGDVLDEWELGFDRVLLGFKTMTVGRIDDPDACAFRGRGAASDVVFDPRAGLVQVFNGLSPVDCPDVGIVLGPPGDGTTLGDGATSDDVVELARDRPAHAIVEASASYVGREGERRNRVRVALRFASDRTATQFAGCRSASRGVGVLATERQHVSVRFAAEHLFREALSMTARIQVQPFADADALWGDDDGVVTMEDLDAVPLTAMAAYGSGYQLADGTRRGTFGDYVRTLFRFTFGFRDERGFCVGNEPEP